MHPRRAVLFLVLIAAALYLPTLWASFVYDDYLHFVENPRILHPQHLGDIFRNGLQETRPVYNTSLAAQAFVFGTSPVAAHAINVLLHILVGVLLFLLWRRVTKRAGLSFMAAAIFLIHPIAVESVAYFNSRSGLLSLLFVLAAILSWLSKRRGMEVAGLVFAILSMASKEDGLLAVPLFLLLSLWTKEKWRARKAMTVLASWLTLPLLYLVFRSPHSGTLGSDVAPWYRYLWEQGSLIPLHLFTFFWPWPLTPDRDLSAVWLSPAVVSTGWLLLLLLCGVLWLKRQSLVALGLIWSLISLLPTHSVVPLLDVQAPRLLYPSLAGLSLALAATLFRVASKKMGVAVVVGALLSIFFIWRTNEQIRLWGDPLALWSADVSAAPSRWRAWTNLSVEYAERGSWEEAEQTAWEAVRRSPKNPSPLYNLAAVSAYRTDGKKDMAQARELARKVLEIEPNHVRGKRLLVNLDRGGGGAPVGK